MRALVAVLVLAVFGGLYVAYRRYQANVSIFIPPATGDLITRSELALRNGLDGNPVWLAIVGHVYDVTKGSVRFLTL